MARSRVAGEGAPSPREGRPPARTKGASGAAAAAPAPARTQAEPLKVNAGPVRPTVLIVDDHPGSLNLIGLEVREWPDAHQFELHLASTGRAAVEYMERAFADRRPLFVLCDVRMTGLTGLDVLQAVAGRSTAPFRFILTTAGEHPGLQERAFQMGADDLVLKTNRQGALWEVLGGRIGRWLRACESQTVESAAAPRPKGA